MSASVSTNCITLENGFIKKEITLKNSRIIAFEIENKLSKRILTALKGSEEFVLSLGKGFFKKRVRASELKIRNADAKALDGKTVLRIDFEPFGFKGSSILASVVYSLKDNDSFIRKHLELSFEKVGSKAVVLDYIDFESLCFDDGLMHWSIPEQKNSHIPGFAMRLGQPVYVDSLYMGCEFPLCLNDIENNMTTLRYYSGKNLSVLAKDGVFVSCNAVVGAAEGDLFAQVQKAFFSYIRTISKPCYLRRQYNSWYDNMLNITTENVTSSFLEIEKGLTK